MLRGPLTNRIRKGWHLSKQSFEVLRRNRGLLRFPLYGGLAALTILVFAGVGGVLLIDSADNATAPGIVLIVIGVYLAIFTGYYFSVGLVAAGDEILRGGEATLADGLRVSRERAGAIAGWALLSTSLGVIFTLIESIDYVGPLIARLLNAAWSLITFMALPVLAIEGTGPIETAKRSGRLFKERWAGQVTGNFAIGSIVFFLGMLPAIAISIGGYLIWLSSDGGAGVPAGVALFIVGVVLLLASMLVLRTLSGIFSIALYRYAVDGKAVGGFSAEQLESAVQPRRPRSA